MRDQLKEPELTDSELVLVLKELKKNGYHATEFKTMNVFVNGARSVTITPTGFHWKDGKVAEWDLTTHSILKKIRNIPRKTKKIRK